MAQSECAILSVILTMLVMVAASLLLVGFGCGTPQAALNFNSPTNAVAGSPFTVTVTVTLEGKPDTIINSYISFTSTDPAAVLPAQYRFTPADAGAHTWTNGFTLMTPGNQTISGSIYDAAGINGSANVVVSP